VIFCANCKRRRLSAIRFGKNSANRQALASFMDGLAKDILKTLCLADALGLAPTLIEVRRFLGAGLAGPTSLGDILSALKRLEVDGKIFSNQGFFCLRGREELIAERLKRLAVTEGKWLLVRRALLRLRHLPWVRLVAICNTVAMGLARRESDVDVFLIVRPGRIWASRLLCHAALAFGSLARRGKGAANRLCLSFTVTDDALALASIAKKPADPYLAAWLATLLPVIGESDVYAKLIAENNWLSQYFRDFIQRRPALLRRSERSALARIFDWLDFFYGRPLNFAARIFQRPRIVNNPESRVQGTGSDVVVNETMLKFHEQDRREEVRERFQKRLAELGIR